MISGVMIPETGYSGVTHGRLAFWPRDWFRPIQCTVFRAAGGEGALRAELASYIAREREELALLHYIQVFAHFLFSL